MSSNEKSEYYHAVVDMGSNGIRCSVSDLLPLTSRTLPTVYQERFNISLYDVQYQNGVKIPIPQMIIDEILILLANFKRTCVEFGVPKRQIQLVATEATRSAINSVMFLESIKETIGFEVHLLSKEEEAKYGAMGMASSINRDVFDGLILDMGGGSVQLTWMQKSASGHVALACFKSFPYGAAALMAQMSSLNPAKNVNTLNEAVSRDLALYFEELRAAQPDALKRAAINGLPVFASGGGLRSWGHILMSLDPVQPYPIPIVNGYVASGSRLIPDLADHVPTKESHRISKRRGAQVPAIQFLINAIVKALGDIRISDMTFCQGGVREGLLFSSLSEGVRSQNALTAAASPFAPKSSSALIASLSSALPEGGQHRRLIPAIVNMLYYHSSYTKDIKAAAALRSTTAGILASTHGISHYDRAILALILCERWGGKDDVPLCDREFLYSLEAVGGTAATWWARYLGCIAKGLADLYPAGVISESLASISADSTALKIMLKIFPCKDSVVNTAQHWAKQLQKLGKRKNWPGEGDARYGLEIDVDVGLRDLAPA